ncbi:MAG: hypothetical protein ACRC3H_12125 [Lachnospiraceae bacterium]
MDSHTDNHLGNSYRLPECVRRLRLTNSKFIDAINNNSGVVTVYNQIVNLMKNHNTIPSFTAESKSSADTKSLEWNGEKYTLTIIDTNGVLADFTFTSSNSDVKISQSGNTLTITSDKVITNDVTLTGTKKIPTVSTSAKLVAYGVQPCRISLLV